MLFARSVESTEMIRAFPGSVANCPDCNKSVISKCGAIKIHHWAHKQKSGCNNWEPTTEWHLEWQLSIKNPIHGYNVEVIVDGSTTYKRADMKPVSGLIIEFQHSRMTLNERLDRELHYKNMIWVVHPSIAYGRVWSYLGSEDHPTCPVFIDRGEYLELNYLYRISKEHFIKSFINAWSWDQSVIPKIKDRFIKKNHPRCVHGNHWCFAYSTHCPYDSYGYPQWMIDLCSLNMSFQWLKYWEGKIDAWQSRPPIAYELYRDLNSHR